MTQNGVSKKRDWSFPPWGYTEVLSFEHTKVCDVAVTAHCPDCASTFTSDVTTDQHDKHVNMRSLLVHCEPRANVPRLQCEHTHIHSSHKQRRSSGLGTRIFTIGNNSTMTIQSQRRWTWPCSLVCMHKSMYACTIAESCLPMPGWPWRPGRQNDRGIKHCMYHPVHNSYNKGTCTCILYKTFSTWGIGYVTVDSHLAISHDIN